MRHLILAAALLAGAAVPVEAAFTTKLSDNQGRTASLRWEPGPGGVRWSLACLDGSDPRRPVELFTYGASRRRGRLRRGAVRGSGAARQVRPRDEGPLALLPDLA